jgi:hypothetical protein
MANPVSGVPSPGAAGSTVRRGRTCRHRRSLLADLIPDRAWTRHIAKSLDNTSPAMYVHPTPNANGSNPRRRRWSRRRWGSRASAELVGVLLWVVPSPRRKPPADPRRMPHNRRIRATWHTLCTREGAVLRRAQPTAGLAAHAERRGTETNPSLPHRSAAPPAIPGGAGCRRWRCPATPLPATNRW